MFCVSSIGSINEELSAVYAQRLGRAVIPQAPVVTGPIGLFVVRDDGANGTKLATEIAASYGYWHERTGHFFDAIFLGWGFDGVPAFDAHSFNRCVSELEERLLWRYVGSANLLVADFAYVPTAGKGEVDFEKAIPLDLSALLEEKKLQQLGVLMEELTVPARTRRADEAAVSTAEISNYIAELRTRRFLWTTLIKKIGTLLGWADDVLPYAVRDLRRQP